MMNLKIAQVVGLNTDQKAAQVISDSRDSDNSFFAVLDLSSDDAFTKGRQILSEVADFYFDFEGSPSEKLQKTFEEIQKRLEGSEFSVLLAAVSGKVLYLISQGAVEAYLKRADNLSSLLSVGTQGQLISGFLQEGDSLFLSTASLTQFLADDLSKLLNLPKEQFEEEVSTRIGSSNLENHGLAALAIEVEQSEMSQQTNLEQDIPSLQEEEAATAVNVRQFWQRLPALKKYLPQTGKGRLIVAVILILIIGLGVGLKIKSAKDAQNTTRFNQAIQKAQDDFNAAKNLASLNGAEAKAKLDSAKSSVNEALGLKPKNTQALDLKKQIDDNTDSILQQFKLSDFPLFLDLDLVKKNFRANQMSLSSGKILLLDPAVKTLISIDIAKKGAQILAGSEQLGEANYFSLNGGLAFIHSKDKGILRVDITNQKISTAAKKDSDLGEIKDIYGFGGNIYLLDMGKKMIWKYLATADGYSDKREYLSKGLKVDFADSLRMQIESSVYVLKKDGEMLRFTRGDKDNFSYGGLDKGVKDPKSFFVSSDTGNLYLLDSGNLRILILTKTGSYKGIISSDRLGQISDLAVDEKEKKVYLLEGSKIFQVDLR